MDQPPSCIDAEGETRGRAPYIDQRNQSWWIILPGRLAGFQLGSFVFSVSSHNDYPWSQRRCLGMLTAPAHTSARINKPRSEKASSFLANSSAAGAYLRHGVHHMTSSILCSWQLILGILRARTTNNHTFKENNQPAESKVRQRGHSHLICPIN